MGTMGVVVVDVVAKKPLEMPSSENERPVQTPRRGRRGGASCPHHIRGCGSRSVRLQRERMEAEWSGLLRT